MEKKFYVVAIYINFGSEFVKNPQIELIGADSKEEAIKMARQSFFKGKKETIEIRITICGEAEIEGEYFGRQAEILY
jgi:hypothetical protein